MRHLRYAFLLFVGVMACQPAIADPVEDFYKGKQIRVVIRAGAGGGYDLYSRLLIRHMVRHIPGNPAAVPVNMPGGSGLTALHYVADVHPKDGTVLSMITQTFPMEQALGLNERLKTDMRRLNWIGNISNSNSFLLTSRASATRTLEDATKRETIIGVPSLAETTAWLVRVVNGTLGTRFRLVTGYNSGPAITLAMERNEIEGRGTSNPKTVFAGGSEIGPDGKPLFNFILQSGLREDPNYQNVPLLLALAANAEHRQIFDFISKAAVLARPVATNADVPPERVAALRRAFEATMKDPQFLAEAQRQGMEINPMTGAEVQELVADIVNAAPGAVDGLRVILK
jgi:predicted nucleic acid-binding protein